MTLKIDFLTSSEDYIKTFGSMANEGLFKYSELKEVFDKVKKTEYTREEIIIVIKNIILASFRIPYERTDFHTLSGEALLQLADTFEIDGSLNLKILYALFLYIFKKEKNEKSDYSLNYRIPLDLCMELCNRAYNLSKSDEQKETGILIKRVCDELIFPNDM